MVPCHDPTMPSSPDPDRQRRLIESARALPPADREAHVRREAGRDDALRDAVLRAVAADDAATQATTAREGTIPSTGEKVQSSATDELMDRLAESPKLDVERYEFEGEVDRGGMGALERAERGLREDPPPNLRPRAGPVERE